MPPIRTYGEETCCIPDDGSPWLPFAPYSELVMLKILAVDPARGRVVCLMRAPPGTELPPRRTTGSTLIYTLQGRWKYREHDWVAGPGSVVSETSGDSLTAQALPDGTDDVMVMVIAEGEQQLLDENGQVAGVENWRTALDRYAKDAIDREQQR